MQINNNGFLLLTMFSGLPEDPRFIDGLICIVLLNCGVCLFWAVSEGSALWHGLWKRKQVLDQIPPES